MFSSPIGLLVGNFILPEIWDVLEGLVVIWIFALQQGLPLVSSEVLERAVFVPEACVVLGSRGS